MLVDVVPLPAAGASSRPALSDLVLSFDDRGLALNGVSPAYRSELAMRISSLSATLPLNA